MAANRLFMVFIGIKNFRFLFRESLIANPRKPNTREKGSRLAFKHANTP